MYVETECPTCNSRMWANIGLDVTQTKTNTADGTDTIAAYTLRNVEVSETLTAYEFVRSIKEQITKKGAYKDVRGLEGDLINCFGIARRYTHCLMWQMQSTEQKKTVNLDYFLCHIIWFLEGLRTPHNRRYFMIGAIISAILVVLLAHQFSHSSWFLALLDI